MSAEWLLEACEHLDGVLAAEGLSPVPDPDEPGAMLCRAARTAITAWRRPADTSAERDTTIEQFITAVGFLVATTMSLAGYAPRRRAIDLRAVAASLSKVTACLSKAVPPAQRTSSPGPFRAAPRRPRKNGR